MTTFGAGIPNPANDPYLRISELESKLEAAEEKYSELCKDIAELHPMDDCAQELHELRTKLEATEAKLKPTVHHDVEGFFEDPTSARGTALAEPAGSTGETSTELDPTYSGARLHPADREIIRLRATAAKLAEALEAVCSEHSNTSPGYVEIHVEALGLAYAALADYREGR